MKYVAKAPRELTYFEAYAQTMPVDDDFAQRLKNQHVEQIAEIFKTPLTGTYNWDYTEQDNRIKRLYQLGKDLNWDAQTDINWYQNMRELTDEHSEKFNSFHFYPSYQAMSQEKKDEFSRHYQAWALSQFLHGEQGALLVASQLCSCAPTYNAKLYAASQTFDEARHVEVFSRYLKERLGLMYPINTHLKSILDKILTDERWDLKFIGMQVVIEGLALSAFGAIKVATLDPVLNDVLDLVIRDESRHVTFGVNYLEEFVACLTDEEREQRAMFAYEACVISRERLIPTDVFQYFGWDVEEAREYFLTGTINQLFRKLLFSRVLPNLKRIGLLTDSVRPKFEELGILEYENLAHDGDINWVELERPLEIKTVPTSPTTNTTLTTTVPLKSAASMV